MKINLDSPRTDLRIKPELKQKAARLADYYNLRFNQMIERLIEMADEPGSEPNIREAIADLQKKTAQLDERLHDLQKRKPK